MNNISNLQLFVNMQENWVFVFAALLLCTAFSKQAIPTWIEEDRALRQDSFAYASLVSTESYVQAAVTCLRSLRSFSKRIPAVLFVSSDISNVSLNLVKF